MTTTIMINPGSGPVEGGTAQQAMKNVQVLVEDVLDRCPGAEIRVLESEGPAEDGRWTFDLKVVRKGITVDLDVEMPGLPLEQVRFLRQPDQNIWDFPRLYVDGDSWVWFYAIEAIGVHPFGEEA